MFGWFVAMIKTRPVDLRTFLWWSRLVFMSYKYNHQLQYKLISVIQWWSIIYKKENNQILRRFGDRVKKWMTMSGPQTEAEKGYDTGEFAPGITVIHISFINSFLGVHPLQTTRFWSICFLLLTVQRDTFLQGSSSYDLGSCTGVACLW